MSAFSGTYLGLPKDLLPEVLRFLPVLDLVRYRRVCRAWNKASRAVTQFNLEAARSFSWLLSKKAKDTHTISTDGRLLSRTQGTSWEPVKADVRFAQGVHMWKLRLDHIDQADGNTWKVCVGVCDADMPSSSKTTDWGGGECDGWALSTQSGEFVFGSKNGTQSFHHGQAVKEGGEVLILLDLTGKELYGVRSLVAALSGTLSLANLSISSPPSSSSSSSASSSVIPPGLVDLLRQKSEDLPDKWRVGAVLFFTGVLHEPLPLANTQGVPTSAREFSPVITTSGGHHVRLMDDVNFLSSSP